MLQWGTSCVLLACTQKNVYVCIYITYNYDQFAPKHEQTPETHWKVMLGEGQKHVAP